MLILCELAFVYLCSYHVHSRLIVLKVHNNIQLFHACLVNSQNYATRCHGQLNALLPEYNIDLSFATLFGLIRCVNPPFISSFSQICYSQINIVRFLNWNVSVGVTLFLNKNLVFL